MYHHVSNVSKPTEKILKICFQNTVILNIYAVLGSTQSNSFCHFVSRLLGLVSLQTGMKILITFYCVLDVTLENILD